MYILILIICSFVLPLIIKAGLDEGKKFHTTPAAPITPHDNKVYVSSYFRADGTYVSSYVRSK